MASPTATESTPPILLDLDASPIPGQIGWAVLDHQGNLVSKSSSSAVSLEADAKILFQMLQESNTLLESAASSTPSGSDAGDFRRLTVTFPGDSRFVVTLDATHVYIVQTRLE